MTVFDCNFFTLFLDHHVRCFWNSEQPESLNLVTNDVAQAQLSIATGLYADKQVIEESIIRAVAARGGYLAPMDEEYPDELTLLIDDRQGHISQHHLLRYGESWAARITVYDNYNDRDIEILRAVLSSLMIKVEAVAAAGDHSAHHLEISDSTFFSTIGSRRMLEGERNER